MKNIVFASSECFPFVKTGGLADVVGSLPKYFDKEKFDVRVIMPKYSCIKQELQENLHYKMHFMMPFACQEEYVGVFEAELDMVKFYFIDNEKYFSGDTPYGLNRWDVEKYIFFCKAVLSALPAIPFRPDIVHCHDWQTGLIPVYLKDCFMDNEFYRGIKSVMTIHNSKFQGVEDRKIIQHYSGLSDYYFTSDKLCMYEDGNLLKGGCTYADAITTVSQTYAEEIKTEYFGERLDGLMRARANSLRGIVNGIDYDEYNPKSDRYIDYQYDRLDFRRMKKKNKKELQKRVGLEIDEKTFMIAIISRLTDQKGLDLLACVLRELCQLDIQLVVLGTGEKGYEDMFHQYQAEFPGKVSANIFYSDEMAHQIYASADALLMPSHFEPCGLSQLIALRYGTVPIVRETGGLKDTVEPYNQYQNTGTGFGFANYNAHEMLFSIKNALDLYANHKKAWNQLVERGMEIDFSWNASVKKYEEMYDWMIQFL